MTNCKGWVTSSPDPTNPRCEFCPALAEKYGLKNVVLLICHQTAVSAVEKRPRGWPFILGDSLAAL